MQRLSARFYPTFRMCFMSEHVRVALVGVGNCASSLVQGVHYYHDVSGTPADEQIPGLMHAVIGGYSVHDIVFTAAFDINEHKVGLDLAQAIFTPPNNTIKFADVPFLNAPVYRGSILDGIGLYAQDVIATNERPKDDIVRIFSETRTDVLVNYLPVGSDQATRWYAEQALEARCAFINCIPVFIAC